MAKPRLIHCATLPRVQIYKLLGMAKNSLNMPEDVYRELLVRHGAQVDAHGYASAKSMNSKDLESALHEMQIKGAVLRKPAAKDWRKKRLSKCMAIWHALADAGVINDRSHDALDAFVRNRVPGVTQLRWAESGDLNKAVEMLKQYSARNSIKVY